ISETGLPFELEPIRSVDHVRLTSLARQWAVALDHKFQGDEECGCVPHHYALRVEETSEVNSSNGTVTSRARSAGQVQVQLTFKDDGSFVGNGQYMRIVETSVEAPEIVCSGRSSPRTVSWSLSGSVVGSDLANPGVMHLKADVREGPATMNETCRTRGVVIPGPATTLPETSGSLEMPD